MSTSSLNWKNMNPPKFGHPMLEYFAFDPGYTNLNHGSYGSLPLPVLDACKALDAEAESNPDRWIRFTYLPLLTSVRERVATLLGANTDECVLVPNTSHGISIVLRNFEWRAGDILVVFNSTYSSVGRTARYISDTPPHPTLSEVKLVFPTTPSEVVAQFRQHLKSLPRSGNGQKIVAVIDAIISMPALLLPWKEMVRVCKEEGVLSVIDAAHSIGQEVNLELGKAEPDFWVSNLHKWLYVKRSCAVLYVPRRNQHFIKSSFPTPDAYLSPSERTRSNFVELFNWSATMDFVPWLSASAALDFRKWLGGEEKINTYCRELALEGSKRLASILGTQDTVMDPTGTMTLNMVNVKLPLASTLQPRSAVIQKMRQKLIFERKIFTPPFFLPETGWWTRCSAQIWNEVGDFEKLGRVLVEVCSEITEEMRVGVYAKL